MAAEGPRVQVAAVARGRQAQEARSPPVLPAAHCCSPPEPPPCRGPAPPPTAEARCLSH